MALLAAGEWSQLVGTTLPNGPIPCWNRQLCTCALEIASLRWLLFSAVQSNATRRHRRYPRVFCPHCGTQNDDSASACQKCAFNLKGAAAPKFKGTMLMVNAPPLGGMAPRPGGQGQPGAGASPSARPPAVAPRAAAPAGGKPMMKATMIGVAPPSPGGIAPPVPPGAGQTPSRPPPPPPASTRPVQPKFAGSAPTAPAFAMPPQVPAPVPAPAPVPFQSAPQPAPEPPRVPEVKAPDIVNPLGGTMVATPSPQSPASPGGGFQPFSPAQAPAPVAGPDAGSFG